MASGFLVKSISLFLIASVCLLGYTSMNAWATLTPTPGMVAIDNTVVINQSSTVRVFIAGGGDLYLDKLVVSNEYVQVNDSTQIGVQSTVPCNLNLSSWTTIPVGVSGTVATFSIWSSGVWVPFTFFVGNLNANHWFNIYIDGQIGPTMLTASPQGTIGFSYAGNAGTHQFIVKQLDLTPPVPELINMLFLFLILGVMMAPLQLVIKGYKTKKMPLVKDFIMVFLVVVIGLALIGVAWVLAGGL